jgi:hypothetical protein
MSIWAVAYRHSRMTTNYGRCINGNVKIFVCNSGMREILFIAPTLDSSFLTTQLLLFLLLVPICGTITKHGSLLLCRTSLRKFCKYSVHIKIMLCRNIINLIIACALKICYLSRLVSYLSSKADVTVYLYNILGSY